MSVRATVGYLNPELHKEVKEQGGQVVYGSKDTRHATTVKREVIFHDARQINPSLEIHGVTLAPLRSAVKDYHDVEEVRAVLYKEAAALAQRLTGATHAVAYGHITRSENPAAEARLSGMTTFTHAYARFAHSDTSKGTFPIWCHKRLRRFAELSEEECNPETMDVAFVNVWKPYDRPVVQNPFAVLDYSTVDPESEIVPMSYTGGGYPGQAALENEMLLESGRHRWLFWPGQSPEEAVVFKQHDTRTGVAKSGFHTAFDDPTLPPGAPKRRSIECHVILGFPKKKKKKKNEEEPVVKAKL